MTVSFEMSLSDWFAPEVLSTNDPLPPGGQSSKQMPWQLREWHPKWLTPIKDQTACLGNFTDSNYPN